MYDSSLPVIPPPLPEQRKHSPLGIASMIVSIIAAVGLCLTLGLSVYGETTSTPTDAFLSIVGFAAICSGAMGLIGLGLGIGALFQKAQSKVFSIIGLVLGAVVSLALCVIIVIGLLVPGTV